MNPFQFKPIHSFNFVRRDVEFDDMPDHQKEADAIISEAINLIHKRREKVLKLAFELKFGRSLTKKDAKRITCETKQTVDKTHHVFYFQESDESQSVLLIHIIENKDLLLLTGVFTATFY